MVEGDCTYSQRHQVLPLPVVRNTVYRTHPLSLPQAPLGPFELYSGRLRVCPHPKYLSRQCLDPLRSLSFRPSFGRDSVRPHPQYLPLQCVYPLSPSPPSRFLSSRPHAELPTNIRDGVGTSPT